MTYEFRPLPPWATLSGSGNQQDILIDAFESAPIAAYKRNYGTNGNVRAGGPGCREVQIFASKTVVEEVNDP